MSHAETDSQRQDGRGSALCSGAGFGDDDEIAPARQKSKRTRIKDHRANRNRRRFYVVIDGIERSRDTGVRQPFTIFPLPNTRHEPMLALNPEQQNQARPRCV